MLPRWDELILLAVSVASAILAVAVYSRAPDRVWNRLFAVQAAAVSFWVLLNYLLQGADTVGQADLWLRLTHPASALVVCAFADIFWVFPERIEPAPLRRRLALYGLGGLFSCVAFLPQLYKSLQIIDGAVVVDYGWPFPVFGLFVVGVLAHADITLLGKFRRLTGLQRVQVKYVLVGTVLGQSLALLTNVLMPLIWHDTQYSRWGPAAYIFVISFMAYAIAKHHIVRPIVAFTRAAAYVFASSLAMVMLFVLLRLMNPFLVVAQQHYGFYIAAGLLVGIAVVPLHLMIRRWLERSLAGAHRAETARQASKAILRTLDSQELPPSLARLILHLLQAGHVSVFLRRGAMEEFHLAARETAPGLGSMSSNTAVIGAKSVTVAMLWLTRDLLDRSQVRRFQSFKEAQLILPEMRDFDAEIVAPILWEDQLMGLVVIGERLAGDMYGPEERQMLRNLLPQVSLAVRNAELFDGVVQMKEYNENIVRQMQSGLIAVNANRTISMFNPAAEHILGVPAEEIIGKPLDLLPDKIAARLTRALSGIPVRSEDRLEVETANGEKIAVACSTSRWRGSALVEEGAIAVISDLTLVEELERERRDAEHLSLIRLLSAGMAHELRNPLVAIRTFAELLPTRWEDAEFRMDFLATAQDEIDRIDRLLTNMLMLSKPADAVVESIEVDTVCEGVIRAMSAGAEAKGIQLIANLSVGSERPFFGDRSRLHQALVNLVKNAVEAEPVGGIVRVMTCEVTLPDRQPAITITIHNDNSYIPEDQLDLIFHPFYTRRAGGTGLGLPVCQTIIQEHKGTIRATSHPRAGTSFAVELPLSSVSGESTYDHSARHRS